MTRKILTQLQVFKIQTYMNEHKEVLCGRTIQTVKLDVQYAMKFDVSRSRIIDTAKMLKMRFSRNTYPSKDTEKLNKLKAQVRSLAIAIKELYDDTGMKPRQEMLEIINYKK